MQSNIDIETENPGQVKGVIEQSLESNEKINYTLKESSDSVKVKVETESLGQLRGCTDTVFRLTTLSKKILER